MSGLTLDVYNATNVTYLGTLSQVLASEFVDEYNGTGVGTCVVPLGSADATLLAKDVVVRVTYQGAVRFAWVVESRERLLADSGNHYELSCSGRGLLSWLEDAVVYPQGGLADFNSPERPFNYASADGSWRASVTYTSAQGVQQKNDTSARKGLPVRWKDPTAQWIWRTDPLTAVQRGTVNWFWREFTLTEAKRVKFYASCDNSMEVYLDGALVMSSSDFDQEAASFTQMARFTARLGAGTHTLAARVRNGNPWTRYDVEVKESDDKVSISGHGLTNGTRVKITDKKDAAGLTSGDSYYVRAKTDDDFKLATTNADGTIVNVTSDGKLDLTLVADNSAGFILTGFEIDDAGRDGTNVIRTNTAWSVTATEPKWYPALIVKALSQEAATRGVYRLNGLTYGYTFLSPTSGSWTTEVDLTLKVGSTLLTVLDDMVDLGVDFWLNPATNRLDAWESRGTNRASTIVLDTGVNLIRYNTQVEPKLKTVALVRTKAGWLQTASTLRATNGWRETFLEYGNTASEDTAKANANRVLRRTGKTQVVANSVEVAVITGAVPYVDFDVADLVSIANPVGNGTLGSARILSISLKDDGGRVTFSPELEVITSA